MSMMLTTGDIEFMKNSVRDIIDQWHTKITIMQPLPLDKQENYDKLLHEFTGDVLYETLLIPAERKDLVNNYTNHLPPDNTEYGVKNAGTILFAIPNVISVYNDDGVEIGKRQFKPHKEAVIAIDDTSDRYRIDSIRDRIGETLITIKRYVGNVPNNSDIIEDDKMPIDGLADVDIMIGGDIDDKG